jgi:uncharacterized protein (UPF0216 family)
MTHTILLKQYADTGAILPQYQLEKLSGSLQKTYLRRRVLQERESATTYELRPYELQLFLKLDKDATFNYLRHRMNYANLLRGIMEKDLYYHFKGGWRLRRWIQNLQEKDRNYALEVGDYVEMSDESFKQLNPEVKSFHRQRGKLVRRLKEEGYPADKVEEYFLKLFGSEHHIEISSVEWPMVTQELFEKYFHKFITRLNTYTLPDRFRQGLLMRMVHNHIEISEGWRYNWSKEEKTEALEWLIENDIMRLTVENVQNMFNETKEKYVDKCIERDAQGLRTNIKGMLYYLPYELQQKWQNR